MVPRRRHSPKVLRKNGAEQPPDVGKFLRRIVVAGFELAARVRGLAVHRFVDRVVESLPDEVMEPRAADAADTCRAACEPVPAL